jgi:hypothetical protein
MSSHSPELSRPKDYLLQRKKKKSVVPQNWKMKRGNSEDDCVPTQWALALVPGSPHHHYPIQTAATA